MSAVLEVWVGSLQSASNFDVACTNHKFRRASLAILQDCVFEEAIDLGSSSSLILNFVEWIQSRKVRVTQLGCTLSALRSCTTIPQPFFPNLRILRIIDEYGLRKDACCELSRLFTYCPMLESLELADLSDLRGEDATCLASIPVRCLLLGETPLPDSSVATLLAANKSRLGELSLSLASKCHRSHAELSQCSQLRSLTCRGLRLDASQTAALFSSFPQLNTLVLRPPSMLGSSSAQELDALRELAARCPQLRTLDLGSRSRLSHAHLPQLLDLFPHCRNVSFAGVAYDRGQSLRLRGVAAADDVSRLLAALDLARPLSTLNLRECCALPATGLRALQSHVGADTKSLALRLGDAPCEEELCTLLAACPALQSLALSTGACLTDAVLLAAAKHCPRLASVCIESADHITSQAVCALFARLGDGLRDLFLHSCAGLSDDIMQAAAMHCPRLEVLSVQGAAISLAGLLDLLSTSTVPRQHLYVDTHFEGPLAQELRIRGHGNRVAKINMLGWK